jgi:hypothetical protein
MSLRPISLSIKSSTEILILFSDNLSNNISKDNVSIQSISSLDYLNIKEVDVNLNILKIVTEPQSTGEYYQILLLGNEENPFLSKKGIELINDSSSRKIFFIGFENYNPVRDRMILNAPSNYNMSSGLIRDFISVNAEELYKAQRSAAELLSDNFIRQEVKDEVRVRTSGPKDRFVNEGVFKIKRVSKEPSGFSTDFKEIVYNENSSIPRHSYITFDPISLQEVFEEEVFSSEDLGKFSKKEIFELKKFNVIKILRVLCVKDGVEYEYDIEEFKYSIKNNKYDTHFSYMDNSIDSNHFYISKENNLGDVFSFDSVRVSYLYKDLSINPVGEIEVYKVETVDSESVPFGKSSFYLKNFNICNSNGDIHTRNGVKFFYFYNKEETSFFRNEITFGTKIPSYPGEYAVNYENGEVQLFGEDGGGVESSGIVASYNYKLSLVKNLDYYIVDKDIVFNTKRLTINNTPKIDFDFENIFEEGIHYKNMSHVEVMNEPVGASIGSSFSIKTKNSSINDVFRIKNNTTGEVYQYLYAIDNQVFFSGVRSPEISDFKEKLNAIQDYEEVIPSSSYMSDVIKVKITSVSENYISIETVDGSKIDLNSSKYTLRSSVNGSRAPIRSFVSLSNNITGIVVDNSSEIPPLGSFAYISLDSFIFNFSKSNILDSSGTKIGNYKNSSVILDRNNFKRERFKNTLELPGDYFIDYKLGKIYFSPISQMGTYNYVKYKSSNYRLSNRNILVTGNISRGDRLFSSKELSENILGVLDLEKESDFVYKIDDDYSIAINHDLIKVNKVYLYNNFKNEVSDNITFSFSNKKIELKNSYNIKFREDSSFYYFDIKTPSKFFSIKNSSDVSVITEEGLVFLENIYFKTIINKGSRFDIYALNKDIFNKIKRGDVIINNGNKFTITSINIPTGVIHVTPNVEGVVLNSNYSIDCFANIDISSNVIKINKNILNLKNEVYLVYEKTDASMSPGTEVFIDMDLSYIDAEYKYLKDDIYISYEYGDNEIEWIDNNSILEGETYYVTYEYGAMREKLKSNFGNLTQIPFFTKFPLTVDREFYRDALEGTMSSFVKGPTIDSIDNITKSITKTSPEIDEYFYKNWILSRDFLPENKIEYTGPLKFYPVKFKEGMYFGENNSVTFSTDSFVPSDEGSFSCWIRNDWNGIDNDANIYFDLYSIGKSVYNLTLKESVYSSYNNIGIIPFDSNVGILSQDIGKVSIYNWDFNGSAKTYGNFAINKPISNYTSGVKSTFNFIKSIPFSNLSGLFYLEKEVYSSVYINDFTRSMSLDFVIEDFTKNGTIFYISDRDQSLLPVYYKDSRYIRCECNNPDILDDYIDLKNKTTDIEISIPINISDYRRNFSSEDMEKYCIIADENGRAYKIKKVTEEDGFVTKISIFSLPINKGNIYSDSTKFKDNIIGGSFKILVSYETFLQKNESYYEEINGFKPIYYSEFDKRYEYQISIDATQNIFRFTRDGVSDNLFYSDFKRLDDSFSNFETRLNSSSEAFQVIGSNGFNVILYSGNQEKELNLYSLRIETDGVLTSEDIYVGPSGVKPKISRKFSLNKNDVSGMGTVNTLAYEKGLFIGVTENNTGIDDLGETLWLFKFKAPEAVRVVSDVVNGEQIFEYIKLNYRLEGDITTDGEFSFVSPLSLSVPGFDPVDSGTRKYFKFSGNSKLEQDGWNAVYSLEGDDDFVGEFYKWRKEGSFTSENSTYTVSNIGSESKLSTYIYDDNKDITISGEFRVTPDPNVISMYDYVSGAVNAFSTGISPITFKGEGLSIEIELGLSSENRGLLFFRSNNEIIDFNNVDWNNGMFNDIMIKISEYVDVYFNGQIINRFSKEELSIDNGLYSEISIGLNRYGFQTENIIQVANYEYLSTPRYVSSFQSNDNFYYDDKKIEFSLYLNENVFDGYQDEYSSDNSIEDGYIQDDIDEFIFVADKNRYIYDISGERNESMSLRKSGKGYLVFEIKDKFGQKYSVESNIKHFKSGEIHHIGTSWRLNNVDGDKMHLFVDGNESPNLVRFGSDIPIDTFDKFSDPEKEVLQNFVVKDITFYEEITINVSAGDSEAVFSSSIPNDFEGRSILINSSNTQDQSVGKALVVSNISEDGLTASLLNIDNLEPYIFGTTSELTAVFSPSIGFENRKVFTNLKYQKFRIFVNEEEVGTQIYDVDESGPFIVDSDIDSTVKTRVNGTNNTIEFIRYNSGSWSPSVDRESMVHIKSYGLGIVNINEKISVSSNNSQDGVSIIKTNLPSPIDYSDVKITKIIEPRFIPDFEIISEN